MQYRSRTAYPEPSTPLTVFDRHAAAAFQSLLDDQPLLEPLREAVYGPWMRPLHAVAVAYAAGGQAAAAARFTQLARRSRGLRTLLTRCAAEPRIRHKIADLLAAPVPWEREVVPGLVPAGLTILAGKPHAGKSWLSLELALAVASGSEVCELKDKVLYLAFEDPPWRLQRRLRQLAASAQPAAPIRLQLARARRRRLAPAGGGDGKRAAPGHRRYFDCGAQHRLPRLPRPDPRRARPPACPGRRL